MLKISDLTKLKSELVADGSLVSNIGKLASSSITSSPTTGVAPPPAPPVALPIPAASPTSHPHHHGPANGINNWDKPFWRSTFSDSNGTGSTSRISAALVVFFTMVILLYLTVINRTIPADIYKLGIFSGLLVTTIYYPGKITDIIKTYLSKK